MLAQILLTRNIEPELLAELSEEDKQILFYKIRQEQIRLYNEYESKVTIEENKHKNLKTSQAVTFLSGNDGKEWVWVMGDHQNDKSIEELIEEEAIIKAQQQAIKEIEEQENASLDCTKTLLPEVKLEEKPPEKPEKPSVPPVIVPSQPPRKPLFDKRPTSTQVNDNPPVVIRPAISREERRQAMINRRSTEILYSIKEIRQKFEEQALEDDKKIKKVWIEREERARLAEQERRAQAQEARNRVAKVAIAMNVVATMRNSLLLNSSTSSASSNATATSTPTISGGNNIVDIVDNNNRSIIDVTKESNNLNYSSSQEYHDFGSLTSSPTKPLVTIDKLAHDIRPQNREAAVQWFQAEERLRKAYIAKGNKIQSWFHGIISRESVESMLDGCVPHTFLVRVSERIYGYVVSYRGLAKVKHVLIAVQPPFLHGSSNQIVSYQALGVSETPKFSSLHQLLDYYKDNSISTFGKECLLYPLGQNRQQPKDYLELFEVTQPLTISTRL